MNLRGTRFSPLEQPLLCSLSVLSDVLPFKSRPSWDHRQAVGSPKSLCCQEPFRGPGVLNAVNTEAGLVPCPLRGPGNFPLSQPVPVSRTACAQGPEPPNCPDAADDSWGPHRTFLSACCPWPPQFSGLAMFQQGELCQFLNICSSCTKCHHIKCRESVSWGPWERSVPLHGSRPGVSQPLESGLHAVSTAKLWLFRSSKKNRWLPGPDVS